MKPNDEILDEGVIALDIESLQNCSTCSTTSTDAASVQHNLQHSMQHNAEGLKESLLSETLAEVLKSVIAYCDISNEWYLCRNGIWRKSTRNRVLKAINNELKKLLHDGYSINKLNNTEAFLKLILTIDSWTEDKNLLPLKNGILSIKQRELMAYSSDYKFTWQLPYEYKPDEKLNIIETWLKESTNNDEEVINVIRAFFKIALTGGKVQKFLEIIGAGGTGKSTLTRLLNMLVGEENSTTTDLKNLELNRFETAKLFNKRLAIINDSTRYGGEVSVLKALTGGDSIRLEVKNKQQGESFTYYGVVVIVANEAIQSTDYSSGLARRRMPVIFNNRVTDEDKDKWRELGGIEKAMEKEIPALLNWVLSMPEEDLNKTLDSINKGMTKAQLLHITETNKLAAWIDDCLVLNENNECFIGGSLAKVKEQGEVDYSVNSKLYPNYESWCSENKVKPVAVQRFSNSLVDIAELLKFKVEKPPRDAKGRKIKGFSIRRNEHNKEATPITKQSLIST
ncbi:MAG: phage/plasmid primase, P4 family [Methyloprofundus sp.]|nr:phage/plasmid primase, P4 family [Methyloprofundus sp.]